jgi:hypothetical protein
MTHAAELIPSISMATNEGYNDPAARAPKAATPAPPSVRNARSSRCSRRDLWGTILVSDVPVYIGAQFNPLCAQRLGSAAPRRSGATTRTSRIQGTWYSAALADALAKETCSPTRSTSTRASARTSRSTTASDGITPAGQLSFLDVVMHEFGHCLGFQNFEDEGSGNSRAAFPTCIRSSPTTTRRALFWPQHDGRAARAASGVNYGKVCSRARTRHRRSALVLDPRIAFRVTTGGATGEYSFGTASFGAPVTPANFNGHGGRRLR